MASIRETFITASTGAVGALGSTIPAARCTGAACTSCYGCAGLVAGLLVILLVRKFAMKRGDNHGLDECSR